MSDDEWARWKRTFQSGGKPMPNIIKRAKTDRLRAVVGVALVYVIAAGELAFAVPRLLAARTAVEAMAPLVIIAAMILIGVAVAVSVRGTLGASGATPNELLDALERRHAGRRKLGRFMPWGIGFCTLGTLGSVTAAMIAAGELVPALAAVTVALGAFTVGSGWLVIRHTNRLIDRELREAAEARRLLAEPIDPDAS